MSDNETSEAACVLHQMENRSKLLERMSLQRTNTGLETELNRAIRKYEIGAGGNQEQLRNDTDKTQEELTAVLWDRCELYAEVEKMGNFDALNYELLQIKRRVSTILPSRLGVNSDCENFCSNSDYSSIDPILVLT